MRNSQSLSRISLLICLGVAYMLPCGAYAMRSEQLCEAVTLPSKNTAVKALNQLSSLVSAKDGRRVRIGISQPADLLPEISRLRQIAELAGVLLSGSFLTAAPRQQLQFDLRAVHYQLSLSAGARNAQRFR